jgi:hypothetical protein
LRSSTGDDIDRIPLSGVPGRVQALTRSPRWQWRKALEPIPTVIRWYVSHPAAGTLLLGAFLVVKCFVLSKGDIPTALGILHTTLPPCGQGRSGTPPTS